MSAYVYKYRDHQVWQKIKHQSIYFSISLDLGLLVKNIFQSTTTIFILLIKFGWLGSANYVRSTLSPEIEPAKHPFSLNFGKLLSTPNKMKISVYFRDPDKIERGNDFFCKFRQNASMLTALMLSQTLHSKHMSIQEILHTQTPSHRSPHI